MSFLTGYASEALKTIEKTDSLSSHFSVFQRFDTQLEKFPHLMYHIALLFIIIFLFLITIEIIRRLSNDSIYNYLKSIKQTIQLRRFLKQYDRSNKEILDKNHSANYYNPIHNCFNHTANKCTVDINKDTVSVFIKAPTTQQAQKVLKEMIEDIKEEITSLNPNYYFSSLNREYNKLWFIGTRR